MLIVYPNNGIKAYFIAAQAFQKMYLAVTGILLKIVTEAEKDDLVIIGGDDVNEYAVNASIKGVLPLNTVPIGSDGFSVVSVCQDNRDVLFINGGRARSTLYGVYYFFEKYAGCRYFWDGDVIPHCEKILIEGINENVTPRFKLRGLRYFAHRGLHRFQAEHWGLEDWKNEIDWLVKRGLNFFMLRIGNDDLFQKAFPDIVSYPPSDEEADRSGNGYDNRTLFWSLEKRGELRKNILQYAFDRDLIHPEDCGTTTHWYTRTPLDYIKKIKPEYMPQVTDVYRQPTGLVWDIRKDKYLNDYFKLTDTHIKEYGQAEMFHTIGLAERMCCENREENMRFKKMAYRRILSKVQTRWKNAPVLIASWDFAMNWQPDEVKELIKELNQDNHIVFDYTADTQDAENNFINWGFYKNHPWVFGIFHAFEPNSDIRGDYKQLSQRLELAADDEMCKGLVFWPELSHSDTLMLEFFAKSTWQRVDMCGFLQTFCQDRYLQFAKNMLPIWEAILPLLKQRVWRLDREAAIEDIHQEYFFDVLGYKSLTDLQPKKLKEWNEYISQINFTLKGSAKVIKAAQKVIALNQNDFMRRDIADLVRTALGRSLNLLLLYMVCNAANGTFNQALSQAYIQLLYCLCDVLDSHQDYLQANTLEKLKTQADVNKFFEPALKENLANSYCRGYASEFMRELCVPENEVYIKWLCEYSKNTKAHISGNVLDVAKKNLYVRYMSRSLHEMRPSKNRPLKQCLGLGLALKIINTAQAMIFDRF